MTQFFRYRYNDQYFNNCWAVKLFEKQNNTFVHYETEYDQYRAVLKDGIIDYDRDYDAEYLAHLRQTKKYIRLYYSGGSDSHHILTTALANNIFIDEIVVNTRNLYNSEHYQPCDHEIVELVKPVLATLTPQQVGKIVYRNFDAEYTRNLYSDPDWMFKVDGGDIGFIPHQIYTPFDNDQADCQIVGLEKPSLLCYRRKWYATTIDLSVITRANINNPCLFYMMPQNIKSYVKKALEFKKRILSSDRQINMQFDLIPHTVEHNTQVQTGKYKGSNFLNGKDKLGFQEVLYHEDFDLIRKWHNSIEHLVKIFPELQNGHSYYRHPAGKFLWFIDLETLEMFSQVDLIPNGFE